VGLCDLNIAAESRNQSHESFFAAEPSVTDENGLRIGRHDMKRPTTAIQEIQQGTHARQDSRVPGRGDTSAAVTPNG